MVWGLLWCIFFNFCCFYSAHLLINFNYRNHTEEVEICPLKEDLMRRLSMKTITLTMSTLFRFLPSYTFPGALCRVSVRCWALLWCPTSLWVAARPLCERQLCPPQLGSSRDQYSHLAQWHDSALLSPGLKKYTRTDVVFLSGVMDVLHRWGSLYLTLPSHSPDVENAKIDIDYYRTSGYWRN